ncbi:hypothetical protein [Pantoea stewartii]|uniref:hypothetical protein n=1 Tax=Pantoea stewartii TaxID=66269 RepID=UPI0025A2935A|nr:hypothetical protein [Pantoea stewartii]
MRTTKNSISIAGPDGGRASDSRGIYEQSFNAGEGLRAEIEVQQQTTGEMLKAHSASTRSLSDGTGERRENQRRHRPRPGCHSSHEL